MRKLLLMFLAAIALSLTVHAQETKKPKDCGCSFSSTNQIGLLEGSTGTSFQFQTINGARYKNWFAGIGIGYDRYRVRSVPLFLDLRWTLFSRPNTPFVYGDVGYNFAWPEDRDTDNWWESEFRGGVYYDAGIGYRLGIGKTQGIVFSGGFSMKRIREERLTTICGFAGCTPNNEVELYDFKLRRISLKVGIQL